MCARRSPSAPKLQGVGKPSSDGWWYLPPIAPRWRGRRHFFFEQQTRPRRQAAGRSSRSAPPSHPAQASRWRASSLFDRTLTRCATARSVAAVRRLRPRAALSLFASVCRSASARLFAVARCAASRRFISARRYTRHTRDGLSACGRAMFHHRSTATDTVRGASSTSRSLWDPLRQHAPGG